jgi:hypothetical protein
MAGGETPRLVVVVPDEPPVISPEAARVLLRILRAAASRDREVDGAA